MKYINLLIDFTKNLAFNKITCSIFCITAIQLVCIPPVGAQIDQREIEKIVDEGTARLQDIHMYLHLIHGNLQDEYPEQLMAAMFIQGDAKVLELGGNVGRNSCVIASLLNDERNLVVVESSLESAKLLEENRYFNNLGFQIENSAISKVPLIQSEWKTIPSKVLLPGYTRVNTITFKEVQKKYNIEFDTLVVDCEGALYYILLDDPTILKNIKLIIIENDFETADQMLWVQQLFSENNLKCVFNQTGGYGPCCYDHFYQVWKK